MIIVNLKPTGNRTGQSSQERSNYYVSGLVNWQIVGRGTIWRPPTDVYETEEKIVVRVEIAGMHDGDVAVNFDRHILSISGNRPEVTEKRAFHQMEIHFGDFISEIEINMPIDVDNIKAEYHDGFLRVFLPKAASRQINVNAE